MRYVFVTGGELKNKGAQAMSFVTVDQIAKKYPDCRVVLISPQDALRSEEEKERYRFDIIAMPRCRHLLHYFSPVRALSFGDAEYKKTREYLSGACAMLDISGYVVGSNWGLSRLKSFAKRIDLAKRLGIPMYIMPQSFGPFDFDEKEKAEAEKIIRRSFPYATFILARENDGLYQLEKFGLTNIQKSPDMVLQSKEVNPANIYEETPAFRMLDVPQGSVAVIPNKKNEKYGGHEKMSVLYRSVIDSLLGLGKNVFLIYHAQEDREVCLDIKKSFYPDDSRVTVADCEYTCLEFEEIVGQFDFIIASRFHSIVHSYKHAVPAVVLGWAVKYQELLALFGQETFQFDVRGEINTENLSLALMKMNEERSAYSASIAEKMAEIRRENIFDRIEIKQ